MALKAFYESQAEIPEQFAEHYSEQGGRWMLTLEGGEPVAGAQLKSALDSERKQREKYQRDLKDMQSKLSELEQARAATAVEQVKPSEDIQKQLLAQKQLFEEQLKQIRSVLESEQASRKQAEERLWQTKFEEAVARAASPLVLEGATDDVIARTRPYFRPGDDGNPVPVDGESVIYGIKDPSRPMSVEEFVTERVLKQAKHLLRPSSGTGTQGSTGNATSGAVSITRDEARNASVYAEAKARAEKAGRPLVIVPTAA